MRVLFATSEIFPFVKTGGLGDVAGALPKALRERGLDVRLMLPGYAEIMAVLKRAKRLRRLPHYFSPHDAELLLGVMPDGQRAYVLNAPHFYDRVGPYGGSAGKDWPDNHLRFAAFSRAATDVSFYDDKWRPDIVHGNDWHTGLMPAYLWWRGLPRPATITTIHNLAYQGLFSAATFTELGLPRESFSIQGLEFHNQVGFLKAALYYSEKINAVSPTYAREIQTPKFGCGLEGLLRGRAADVTGILNGIDTEVWNPATDTSIAQTYDEASLDAKAVNKAALLKEFGFPAQLIHEPLFAAVSRFTHQKGLDLIPAAATRLFERGLRLILMGTGDPALEKQLKAFAASHPDYVAVKVGYEEGVAHRIFAGADAVLVPSRFEPCGLVQMYGLRYGALPIVRRTGGLADTVTDAGPSARAAAGTGFVFGDATAPALAEALNRAISAYRDGRAWHHLQRNAMSQDLGWDKAAAKYAELYEQAFETVRFHQPFAAGTQPHLPPLTSQETAHEPAQSPTLGSTA